MTTDQTSAMREFLMTTFLEHVGLSRSDVFVGDVDLSEIVRRSEKLRNSVELMEAFARTANAAKKKYGVGIRLKAHTMDTRISVVLDEFIGQLTRSGATERTS